MQKILNPALDSTYELIPTLVSSLQIMALHEFSDFVHLANNIGSRLKSSGQLYIFSVLCPPDKWILVLDQSPAIYGSRAVIILYSENTEHALGALGGRLPLAGGQRMSLGALGGRTGNALGALSGRPDNALGGWPENALDI